MKPAFVLNGTPGALPVGEPADIPTVHWLDICHGQRGKEFILIDHSRHRDTSRWKHVDRKRPFRVMTRRFHLLSCSSTLAGALKIARRLREELP